MLLYLIPTPIGNLEDITLRALRILKEVDIILAEDTRVTRILLKHYNINNQMFSFHSYNEHKVLQKWIAKIKNGETVALVSDAGTPSISDPGFLLVRECLQNGINVKCLPGPTAFLPALVSSGIPCDKFVFEGFLPVKKGRKKRIQELSSEDRTMIFYESPHRILKTLKLFLLYFGEERKITITREISKIYEETVRGSIIDLIEIYEKNKPKGEFVIIVSGNK